MIEKQKIIQIKILIGTRTHLNYYIKKNKLTYTKEFDKLRTEKSLAGNLRENSIIMCQMIFTSDQEFFDRIGESETKRYFNECYKFICNYKELGEENIISAVVHLDEGSPHLHLMFVPVVQAKDKDGKDIQKICARDFWKGRDSYRKLQDAYFNYVKSKGFDLERGCFVEETNRQHYSVEKYKEITNFRKTKEVLKDITLELPEVPDIKDIKKVMINRDEKIVNEIIKPKDELIKKLYNDNVSMHKELSKQSNTVDFATKFKAEYIDMLEKNTNLKLANSLLQENIENKDKELALKLEIKTNDIESKYKKKINELEKENKNLNKMIDKFKVTLKKFIKWLCHKFSYPSEDELIRNFEKETYANFNYEKQLNVDNFKKKHEDFEKDL